MDTIKFFLKLKLSLHGNRLYTPIPHPFPLTQKKNSKMQCTIIKVKNGQNLWIVLLHYHIHVIKLMQYFKYLGTVTHVLEVRKYDFYFTGLKGVHESLF